MIQAGGIFMASKVKKKQNLQGLTEQQKHIIKLRNELNKPDPHQVKAFTLYKIITYVLMFYFRHMHYIESGVRNRNSQK